MSKLERQPLVGKYRNYSTYSNSGVDWIGEMPAVWTLKRVKHMFTIRKRIAGELGYDILSVTQRGIVVKDIESGEGQLSMDYSKYQRVKPGDFAMNHMDLLTGYVDISDYDGVTSPDYRVFTLDNTDYSAKYFLYIFQMGYQLRLFFHMGQGASHLGRWRLATDEFNEMVFPVPSCEEQRTIAAFLDHETARIDRLIAQQQRLIELLKEKRQSVISHAVTKGLNPNAPMKDSGIEWLGQVPEHWVVTKVKDATYRIVDGPHFSPKYQDEGYMFISARNIKVDRWSLDDAKYVSESDFLEFNKRVKPESDDVLLTKGGTTGIARVVDLDFPFQVWVHVAVLKTNKRKVNPFYLAYTLNSKSGYEQSQLYTRGATNNDLGLSRIANIYFAAPKIQEQEEIVSWLDTACSKLDYLCHRAECSMELLQERRIALISAAVTGKIDLRGWTPPAEEAAV